MEVSVFSLTYLNWLIGKIYCIFILRSLLLYVDNTFRTNTNKQCVSYSLAYPALAPSPYPHCSPLNVPKQWRRIRATKMKGKKRALSAAREGLDWIWFLKLFVFLYSSLYLVLLWKTMDLRVLANMVIYLFCAVACIIYVSIVHYWWCTVAVRF